MSASAGAVAHTGNRADVRRVYLPASTAVIENGPIPPN
jgi:hypothetical protein